MDPAEAGAAELVERLRGDPVAAYDQLRAAAAVATGAARAILLRGAGDAARWAAGHDTSERLLLEACAAAQQAGRDDLRRTAQLTLAGTLYLAGRSADAFAMLGSAADGADPDTAAKVSFQRATMMAREGRTTDAIAAYDTGLSLFAQSGDRYMEAATLGNRALLLLDLGRATDAEGDLRRARGLFAGLGVHASAAWMEHNLGRVAGRTGDVPTALNRFRTAEQRLTELGIDPVEVQVNRCEVLVQAGLYAEAEAVAVNTADRLAASGQRLEWAEATLSVAAAQLGQSRLQDAADSAARAREAFAEQDRPGWALQADVLTLAAPDVSLPAIARGAAVATQLADLGQLVAAARAWSLLAAHDPHRAAAGMRSLPLDLARAPFEARLAALMVDARRADADGAVGEAMRLTARAVRLGEAQRLHRAAADLRAAVSAQVAMVAELGLAIRVRRGRPTQVLQWVERCRAASTEASPRIGSEGTAERMAELRAAQVAARCAAPADVPALLARQAAIQRSLVTRQRELTPSAPLQAAAARLRPGQFDGVTVVQHHASGGRLGAVVVHAGRSRLHELGESKEIHQHLAHLARAYRRLALGDGDAGPVLRRAAALAPLLLPPLPGSAERVVISPLSAHLAVPWAALDVLGDREVSVTHRLGRWLESQAAASKARPARVALLGGPDLTATPAELAAVGAAWTATPGRTEVLADPQSSVSSTLRALATADVAHLACHGERRRADGRFAQLRLWDGDLLAIDIEALPAAPGLVVLAACEAGVLEALPGDESAGLAQAFIAAGAHTVIAPTTLLPDTPRTTALFGALHRAIAGGRRPAAALRDLRDSEADPGQRAVAASVACIGWG